MNTAAIDARHSLRLALMAGVVSLCVATGLATAKGSPTDRQLQKAEVALAQRSDADSLVAAGVLLASTSSNEALALVSRASEAAPRRPEFVWLRAQLCHPIHGCDPEPIEKQLRELDPANGVGWMGALIRAQVAEDDAARNEALGAIGHSDRVDVYFTTLVAGLSRAVARTKAMSLGESETVIIGVLAALAIPAYAPVSNGCKGERLQQPEINSICRGVAKAFMHGDTYITEMIGVAIEKRVWPVDSTEWKEAVEARRLYDYRSKLFVSLNFTDPVRAQQFLSWCADNRREQDVFRLALIAAGKEPDPPPG